MIAEAEADLVSTRQLARRFDVPLAAVVRIVDRLGLARRVGRTRIIRAADAPTIESGLRASGVMERRQAIHRRQARRD